MKAFLIYEPLFAVIIFALLLVAACAPLICASIYICKSFSVMKALNPLIWIINNFNYMAHLAVQRNYHEGEREQYNFDDDIEYY